jgi:hypothetical protein
MRAFAGSVSALSLILLIETLRLDPAARRIPLFVVVPLLILSLLQFVVRAPQVDGKPEPSGQPSPISALLWVASLPLALLLLGMHLGPALFVLSFMRVRGRESWLVSLTGAGLAGLAVALLFNIFLDASTPVGVLLRPFLG